MDDPLPNIDRIENQSLCLRFAGQGRWPDVPVIARPDEIYRPYETLGAHPDLVARLWDELGGALPADCRYVVYGKPTLTHPTTGIIFAFAGGSFTLGLRLPPRIREEALARGAKLVMEYPRSAPLDISIFGPEWVLCGWAGPEPAWCRAAYEFAGSPADPLFHP